MDSAAPAHPPARTLPVEALTVSAFQPYGDVIEASAAAPRLHINEGTAERYDDLARLDLGADGGRPVLSLFRARARDLPLHLRVIERHRLGSQAFMPLGGVPFLVIVAAPGAAPQPQDLQCFRAQPGQGVNFARGTWHHPLVALAGGDFLVIDRGAAEGAVDCEELDIAAWGVWVQAAPTVSGPHRLRVEPLGLTLPVPDGLTLLEAAVAAGVPLPRSCRNGTCRACIARVTQGRVHHRVEWPGLSDDELRDGWVLPCVALADSDLVLNQPALSGP